MQICSNLLTCDVILYVFEVDEGVLISSPHSSLNAFHAHLQSITTINSKVKHGRHQDVLVRGQRGDKADGIQIGRGQNKMVVIGLSTEEN